MLKLLIAFTLLIIMHLLTQRKIKKSNKLQSIQTPSGRYLSKNDGSDHVISVENETKQWTMDEKGQLIHESGKYLYAAYQSDANVHG